MYLKTNGQKIGKEVIPTMLMKTSMLSILSYDIFENKGDEEKVSGVRYQMSRVGCRLDVSGPGNESRTRTPKSEMWTGPEGQPGGRTRGK